MLRRDPTKAVGKKRLAASGTKLTSSKKKLADAIESCYADADKKELLDLLKASGVVVR